MHQPWASLVIDGFKRVEGRVWPSNIKGPLWIHAGAKIPTEGEILEIETQYAEFYQSAKHRPNFPSKYPTGVLLGRVEIVDNITREEYLERTPYEL